MIAPDTASLLKNDERVILRLRSLYDRFGYDRYKMSKFEEYDLYVRNKSFLLSDHIITFTDTSGKLMALKPDVTLSIVKNTKDIPGSHVIMLCDGEEPSERDYTEAASVAARYSKATGDLVAVDYTRVKNIKKPGGAKPGFVIYKTNYTAFVKPVTDAEIEKMKE